MQSERLLRKVTRLGTRHMTSTFDPEASYNFIVDCEYVRIGSLFKTTSSYQIFYCCILKRSAFSLR